MVLVPFLDRRLMPTSADPWIDARAISGGVNVIGDEQVIGIGAGIWRYTMSGIAVRNPSDIQEWRRFVTAMNGRLNTTSVPWFERSGAPWGTDQYGRLVTPKLVRNYQLDGTQFADQGGSTAALDAMIANLINATVFLNPAPAGSTNFIFLMNAPVTPVVINGLTLVITPGIPKAGNVFSLFGKNSHVITEIVGTSGNSHSVRFNPPLRANAPVGSVLNFTLPVCEMRFASDDQGRLPLDMLRMGSGQLEFIEA